MTQNSRRRKQPSMENEVIVAVIVLYLFIALTMMTVHHLQPKGQATVTSSTSPSHGHFSEPVPKEPPAFSPPTTTP
ncbi:MAG: hypothetical protein Q7J29_06555 [Stagnimonas sp.]|nr:hypothetical protein [Stagnimonas sp.]